MSRGRRPLRVFISSASGALAPYRQAAIDVCHRLGQTPVFMEDFPPERPPPADVCRREVEECDVFVLLLAHRYGARSPDEERSYTELEYRWAVARHGLPLLAFVVDPDFPWALKDVSQGDDAEALKRFVATVQRDHVVRPFTTVEAFREDLILALNEHVASVPAEQEQRRDDQPDARVKAPVFHAVPSYVGSAPFTGRQEDLATLDEWGRSADPVMVVEAIGGTGKSALTWQWAQDHAPDAIPGLAGRLWWSFYDGSASMKRFLQEVLAYTSQRTEREINRLKPADLADAALAELERRPYLVVLDGFERLLAAYHCFDPSKVQDDEVETGQRSLIEPNAEDLVRRLTAAGPSKLLISTRLMPTALESRFGARLPGVRHLRLPGLTDSDTRTLLARLDVRGGDQAMRGFFSPLGNHPLLVGVVAGLVRNHRPSPGDFDRWLADQQAGGAFRVSDLELKQRRQHILDSALRGLDPGPRQLLGYISVLAGAVSWGTLAAINPFRPEPPSPIEPDLAALGLPPFPASLLEPERDRAEIEAGQGWEATADELRSEADRATEEKHRQWLQSDEVKRADAHLDAALTRLEEGGLLWWDRAANSYDLHPIIRAYVHDLLQPGDRIEANDRIRDHFQALPPEDLTQVSSVEDLRQTLTIFRALIGAGHLGQANTFFSTFDEALMVHLGGFSTVIELLQPVEVLEPDELLKQPGLHSYLAIAYSNVGSFDRAIRLEINSLSDSLRNSASSGACAAIINLAVRYSKIGSIAMSRRFGELFATLDAVAMADYGSEVYLQRANRAFDRGDLDEAGQLFDRSNQLGAPGNDLWFQDKIDTSRCLIAYRRNTLTLRQLDQAEQKIRSRTHRNELARLRCLFLIGSGNFEAALSTAYRFEQEERNLNLISPPTLSAFILAKISMTEEAADAIELSLTEFPRMHPALRNHFYLASALRELGRAQEAAQHAQAAYRKAWADGPPDCFYFDLRDARELLESMGEPIPDLPTVDPATVKVPLEDEIRAYIAKLESGRDAPAADDD